MVEVIVYTKMKRRDTNTMLYAVDNPTYYQALGEASVYLRSQQQQDRQIHEVEKAKTNVLPRL